MGPVPWEAMKCCHGSLIGINDVFRPQDTLCEVGAEIGSLSQNNIPPNDISQSDDQSATIRME